MKTLPPPAALLALIALLLPAARESSAATCSGSMTNLVFSAVNPLSSQADAVATLHYSCSNFGLLPEYFTACFNIGDGVQGGGNANPRRMLDGAARPLWFQLYSDPARTQVWGSTTFGSNTPVRVNISLGGFGSTNGNLTLYGRVLSGQSTLAAGTYQDAFTASHTLITINNGLFGPPNACSPINSGSSFPFTATATVSANCSVSAAPMNFGTAGVLLGNADASSTISVHCTNGVPWQVGLGNGNHASGNTRRMAGAGGFVAYELYRDGARTQRWGSAAGTTVLGTGTGGAQSLTAYGRVAAQATPAAGTYTDTIVVSVTY